MDKYDLKLIIRKTTNSADSNTALLYIKESSMSHDINNLHFETRKVSGCNVRVFFTEKENHEVEKYVLSNLLNVFEKRNNISNALFI